MAPDPKYQQLDAESSSYRSANSADSTCTCIESRNPNTERGGNFKSNNNIKSLICSSLSSRRPCEAQRAVHRLDTLTVFISKLPGRLSEGTLRTILLVYLCRFGSVKELRLSKPQPSKKQNTTRDMGQVLWHAYCDFESLEAVDSCCKVSKHYFTKFLRDFKIRRNLTGSQRKEANQKLIKEQRKVFLTSIPNWLDSEVLEQEMGKYGTVQDVEIINKVEQGKKIAFITFEEPYRGLMVAEQSPLSFEINGQIFTIKCQVALNPQQLHARKLQESRKSSLEESTEDQTESSETLFCERSDKTQAYFDSQMTKALPEVYKPTVDYMWGPIGSGKLRQHKSNPRVAFFNGVFNRPQAKAVC